jgi:hypothetical protein
MVAAFLPDVEPEARGPAVDIRSFWHAAWRRGHDDLLVCDLIQDLGEIAKARRVVIFRLSAYRPFFPLKVLAF